MSIISETFGLLGQTGVTPRRVQLVVTDNLAAVITPGYLTTMGVSPYTVYKTDIFDIIYDYNAETAAGTYGEFTCTISQAGVITLVYLGVGRTRNPLLPTIDFGVHGDLSVVYSAQFGYWTQVGDAIIVNCAVSFTPTYTTASGTFIINGLPYPSSGATGNQAFGSALSAAVAFTTDYTALTSNILPGSSAIFIAEYGTGLASLELSVLNFPSGGSYIVSAGITYFL